MPSTPTTQSEFNAAYWAHQSPEVRTLKDLNDQEKRMGRAVALAAKGFVIDLPIMGWIDGDPYWTMKLRQYYRYAWVPSALQPPVMVAPGVHIDTLPDYDPDHPPAGSIKVSLDLADYPPFDSPKPAPQPVIGASPVGALIFGTSYLSTPGDTVEDGVQISEARGVFRKHRVMTPFGSSQYWERVA